jgi:hypothetical protein
METIMNRVLAAFRIAELSIELVIIDVRLALNAVHYWIVT